MKKTKNIFFGITLAVAGMSLASCGTQYTSNTTTNITTPTITVTTTDTSVPTTTTTATLPETRPEGSYALWIKGADSDVSPDFPQTGYYEPGSVLSFKVAIATDVSFAVYLNNTQMECKSSDESTDGYDYYEIEMPEHDSVLSLISSSFSTDKDYFISDIEPWADLVTKENLVKVKVRSGNDTKPESEFPLLESTDSMDLEYNLNILKNATLKYDKPYSMQDLSTGGPYVYVTYVLSDGTEYLLSFGKENGWGDFCTIGEMRYYFILDGTEDELPKISNASE